MLYVYMYIHARAKSLINSTKNLWIPYYIQSLKRCNFTVNVSSTKFHPQNIMGKDLACNN